VWTGENLLFTFLTFPSFDMGCKYTKKHSLKCCGYCTVTTVPNVPKVWEILYRTRMFMAAFTKAYPCTAYLEQQINFTSASPIHFYLLPLVVSTLQALGI